MTATPTSLLDWVAGLDRPSDAAVDPAGESYYLQALLRAYHSDRIELVVARLAIPVSEIHYLARGFAGLGPRPQHRRLDVCTCCRRTRVEAGGLIDGPGVYVCRNCVTTARRVLDGSAPHGLDWHRATPPVDPECDFCGRTTEPAAHRPVAWAHLCRCCVQEASVTRAE